MVLLEAFSISVVGVIVGAVAALFNIQFLSRTVSTVLAGYDVPFYFPWLLIWRRSRPLWRIVDGRMGSCTPGDAVAGDRGDRL